MNSTKLISTLFKPRQAATAFYATQAEAIQAKVFKRLIKDAANTEWGLEYSYKDIKSYQDYQRVPLQTYEEIKPYVERMRRGEKNVLWPGEVIWFAKSSGTTNDKSKFIPVSKEGLHDIHYAGGMDAVALYLQQNPDSRFFSGKGLILGGSHASNYNLKRSLVGDLSAILIENVNPLVNLIRVPEKKIALLSDFEEKVEKIARSTMNKNVTNLSGVPSWLLSDISWKSRAQIIWRRYGLIWKCSFMEEWHLLLIANNTSRLSAVIKCTTWRLTMPVKVSSDCKMISTTLP